MNRSTLVPLVREGFIVVGAATIAIGSGMIYPPAGVIVAGMLMLTAGILGVMR